MEQKIKAKNQKMKAASLGKPDTTQTQDRQRASTRHGSSPRRCCVPVCLGSSLISVLCFVLPAGHCRQLLYAETLGRYLCHQPSLVQLYAF